MSARYADPALTGLQQMQAMIDDGTLPPIMATLGFRLVEIGEGVAVFEGSPGPSVYNPLGSVHGGYAATLLDSACGCAVHSGLPVGRTYTTLELKVSYHRGMSSETGTVRAEGRVLSLGRRTGFSEAKLTDSRGRLLASATSTLLVFDIADASRPRGE